MVAQVKAEMGGLAAVKDYDQQVLDKLAVIASASNATSQSTAATLESSNVTSRATTATVQSTAATGQAASAGAQATASMNDQTMTAIASNTATQLNYLAGIIANTKASADSLARIEKQPSTAVSSGSSGGGLLGGLVSGVVGGAIGSATSAIKSVGKIFGFAQGDVFGGQGVYAKPTSFNFSGQNAVIGESGPEGVLPLDRMANGDLGVQAIFPPVDFGGDISTWLQQISTDVRIGASATVQATQAGDERLFDVMLAMQSRMGGMADDIKSQKDMLVQWEADGLPETRI